MTEGSGCRLWRGWLKRPGRLRPKGATRKQTRRFEDEARTPSIRQLAWTVTVIFKSTVPLTRSARFSMSRMNTRTI